MNIKEICQHFQSRVLFYPCAGDDIEAPIESFLPFINDFWFVDCAYTTRRRQPVPDVKRYQPVSTSNFEITGETIRRRLPFTIPVISTVYSEREAGYTFTVNLCAGHGYNVFRKIFREPGKQLSVFFHRGDSPREGGSNFYWLSHSDSRANGRGVIDYVLDSVEPGGLIVTDGSNAMPEFAKFWFNNRAGAESVQDCDPFEYSGRRFECVGYLGNQYGPTLIWTTNLA